MNIIGFILNVLAVGWGYAVASLSALGMDWIVNHTDLHHAWLIFPFAIFLAGVYVSYRLMKLAYKF
jgi:hypothetical protein|tara:strand:+ start:664 stop:861 length:198 start_codon:yes stop_codon:yes gene_type:complete